LAYLGPHWKVIPVQPCFYFALKFVGQLRTLGNLLGLREVKFEEGAKIVSFQSQGFFIHTSPY